MTLSIHSGFSDTQISAELSNSAGHVCLKLLCKVSFSNRATAGPPSGLKGVFEVHARMHAANASTHFYFKYIVLYSV